jgi:hypothetical protein
VAHLIIPHLTECVLFTVVTVFRTPAVPIGSGALSTTRLKVPTSKAP